MSPSYDWIALCWWFAAESISAESSMIVGGNAMAADCFVRIVCGWMRMGAAGCCCGRSMDGRRLFGNACCWIVGTANVCGCCGHRSGSLCNGLSMFRIFKSKSEECWTHSSSSFAIVWWWLLTSLLASDDGSNVGDAVGRRRCWSLRMRSAMLLKICCSCGSAEAWNNVGSHDGLSFYLRWCCMVSIFIWWILREQQPSERQTNRARLRTISF